jgi:hypothetical protein
VPTYLLQQIICNIKIRRAAPTRHDNIDFKPLVKRIANIIPFSVVTAADKAYDSEDNHLLVREQLGAFSVIPDLNCLYILIILQAC